MFCQCYFNRQPSGHAGHEGHGGQAAKHFCRANLAYKINKGHHGATRLDGAKFWVATDLGEDFGDGELDWAVLYFDKTLTPAQRDAIGVVAGRSSPSSGSRSRRRRRRSTSGSSTRTARTRCSTGARRRR